jgi:glycosyltransferase involved in cell wall biosynthesis
MLSVVIATENSERNLPPTLAALVAGAVAGAVREVIVADGGSRDETAAIADAAGCRLLTSNAGRGARLKAAADVARAGWLLFIQPGAVLEPSWIDEASRFVEESEQTERRRAAIFSAARASILSELRIALAVLRRRGEISPSPTLLIAKAHYQALGGHRDIDKAERELIRRIGRRLRRLHTRAMLAQ